MKAPGRVKEHLEIHAIPAHLWFIIGFRGLRAIMRLPGAGTSRRRQK